MKDRYLITQSLLSGWLYSYKTETGYDDFLRTLRREPLHQTKAMLDGIRFENCLNSVLNGEKIYQDHEWFIPITQLSALLCGAQQQVKVSKDVTINGINFVLYGVLDYLKAGIIYDTKYSGTYRVGKYLSSPQHPMYLGIIQEAYEFRYLICDGRYIYQETYRPGEFEPIETTIEHFISYLDRQNLVKTYTELWKSKF